MLHLSSCRCRNNIATSKQYSSTRKRRNKMNAQSNVVAINPAVEASQTVAQLKAQLDIAMKAVADAEREARAKVEVAERAERAAKLKAEEEIIYAKMDDAFAPVKARFAGLVVEAKRFVLTLKNGVEIGISREERSSGSSFHSRSSFTGRYVVTLGYAYRYGSDKRASRYPSKAGSDAFSLDKMLAKAQELIDAEQYVIDAAKAKEAAKQTAGALAAELNEKHNTTSCSATYTSSHAVNNSGRREYTERAAPDGYVYIGSHLFNPAQVAIYLEMWSQIKAAATK